MDFQQLVRPPEFDQAQFAPALIPEVRIAELEVVDFQQLVRPAEFEPVEFGRALELSSSIGVAEWEAHFRIAPGNGLSSPETLQPVDSYSVGA